MEVGRRFFRCVFVRFCTPCWPWLSESSRARYLRRTSSGRRCSSDAGGAATRAADPSAAESDLQQFVPPCDQKPTDGAFTSDAAHRQAADAVREDGEVMIFGSMSAVSGERNAAVGGAPSASTAKTAHDVITSSSSSPSSSLNAKGPAVDNASAVTAVLAVVNEEEIEDEAREQDAGEKDVSAKQQQSSSSINQPAYRVIRTYTTVKNSIFVPSTKYVEGVLENSSFAVAEDFAKAADAAPAGGSAGFVADGHIALSDGEVANEGSRDEDVAEEEPLLQEEEPASKVDDELRNNKAAEKDRDEDGGGRGDEGGSCNEIVEGRGGQDGAEGHLPTAVNNSERTGALLLEDEDRDIGEDGGDNDKCVDDDEDEAFEVPSEVMRLPSVTIHRIKFLSESGRAADGKAISGGAVKASDLDTEEMTIFVAGNESRTEPGATAVASQDAAAVQVATTFEEAEALMQRLAEEAMNKANATTTAEGEADVEEDYRGDADKNDQPASGDDPTVVVCWNAGPSWVRVPSNPTASYDPIRDDLLRDTPVEETAAKVMDESVAATAGISNGESIAPDNTVGASEEVIGISGGTNFVVRRAMVPDTELLFASTQDTSKIDEDGKQVSGTAAATSRTDHSTEDMGTFRTNISGESVEEVCSSVGGGGSGNSALSPIATGRQPTEAAVLPYDGHGGGVQDGARDGESTRNGQQDDANFFCRVEDANDDEDDGDDDDDLAEEIRGVKEICAGGMTELEVSVDGGSAMMTPREVQRLVLEVETDESGGVPPCNDGGEGEEEMQEDELKEERQVDIQEKRQYEIEEIEEDGQDEMQEEEIEVDGQDEIKEERQDEIKEERQVEIKEERQDEIEEDGQDESKEERQDESKEERQDEIKEERQDEIKEERQDEIKEERQDDIDKDRQDEIKEERTLLLTVDGGEIAAAVEDIETVEQGVIDEVLLRDKNDDVVAEGHVGIIDEEAAVDAAAVEEIGEKIVDGEPAVSGLVTIEAADYHVAAATDMADENDVDVCEDDGTSIGKEKKEEEETVAEVVTTKAVDDGIALGNDGDAQDGMSDAAAAAETDEEQHKPHPDDNWIGAKGDDEKVAEESEAPEDVMVPARDEVEDAGEEVEGIQRDAVVEEHEKEEAPRVGMDEEEEPKVAEIKPTSTGADGGAADHADEIDCQSGGDDGRAVGDYTHGKCGGENDHQNIGDRNRNFAAGGADESDAPREKEVVMEASDLRKGSGFVDVPLGDKSVTAHIDNDDNDDNGTQFRDAERLGDIADGLNEQQRQQNDDDNRNDDRELCVEHQSSSAMKFDEQQSGEVLPPKKKKKPSKSASLGDDARRATHFVAIRANDPKIVAKVDQIQRRIVANAPQLEQCCINPLKLHISLLVINLSEKEIPFAKKALRRASSSFRNRGFPSPLDLDFQTVGTFTNRVLFSGLSKEQEPILQQLHSDLTEAFTEVGIRIIGPGKTSPLDRKPHDTNSSVSTPGTNPASIGSFLAQRSSFQPSESNSRDSCASPPPPPPPNFLAAQHFDGDDEAEAIPTARHGRPSGPPVPPPSPSDMIVPLATAPGLHQPQLGQPPSALYRPPVQFPIVPGPPTDLRLAAHHISRGGGVLPGYYSMPSPAAIAAREAALLASNPPNAAEVLPLLAGVGGSTDDHQSGVVEQFRAPGVVAGIPVAGSEEGTSVDGEPGDRTPVVAESRTSSPAEQGSGVWLPGDIEHGRCSAEQTPPPAARGWFAPTDNGKSTFSADLASIQNINPPSQSLSQTAMANVFLRNTAGSDFRQWESEISSKRHSCHHDDSIMIGTLGGAQEVPAEVLFGKAHSEAMPQFPRTATESLSPMADPQGSTAAAWNGSGGINVPSPQQQMLYCSLSPRLFGGNGGNPDMTRRFAAVASLLALGSELGGSSSPVIPNPGDVTARYIPNANSPIAQVAATLSKSTPTTPRSLTVQLGRNVAAAARARGREAVDPVQVGVAVEDDSPVHKSTSAVGGGEDDSALLAAFASQALLAAAESAEVRQQDESTRLGPAIAVGTPSPEDASDMVEEFGSQPQSAHISRDTIVVVGSRPATGGSEAASEDGEDDNRGDRNCHTAAADSGAIVVQHHPHAIGGSPPQPGQHFLGDHHHYHRGSDMILEPGGVGSEFSSSAAIAATDDQQQLMHPHHGQPLAESAIVGSAPPADQTSPTLSTMPAAYSHVLPSTPPHHSQQLHGQAAQPLSPQFSHYHLTHQPQISSAHPQQQQPPNYQHYHHNRTTTHHSSFASYVSGSASPVVPVGPSNGSVPPPPAYLPRDFHYSIYQGRPAVPPPPPLHRTSSGSTDRSSFNYPRHFQSPTGTQTPPWVTFGSSNISSASTHFFDSSQRGALTPPIDDHFSAVQAIAPSWPASGFQHQIAGGASSVASSSPYYQDQTSGPLAVSSPVTSSRPQVLPTAQQQQQQHGTASGAAPHIMRGPLFNHSYADVVAEAEARRRGYTTAGASNKMTAQHQDQAASGAAQKGAQSIWNIEDQAAFVTAAAAAAKEAHHHTAAALSALQQQQQAGAATNCSPTSSATAEDLQSNQGCAGGAPGSQSLVSGSPNDGGGTFCRDHQHSRRHQDGNSHQFSPSQQPFNPGTVQELVAATHHHYHHHHHHAGGRVEPHAAGEIHYHPDSSGEEYHHALHQPYFLPGDPRKAQGRHNSSGRPTSSAPSSVPSSNQPATPSTIAPSGSPLPFSPHHHHNSQQLLQQQQTPEQHQYYQQQQRHQLQYPQGQSAQSPPNHATQHRLLRPASVPTSPPSTAYAAGHIPAGHHHHYPSWINIPHPPHSHLSMSTASGFVTPPEGAHSVPRLPAPPPDCVNGYAAADSRFGRPQHFPSCNVNYGQRHPSSVTSSAPVGPLPHSFQNASHARRLPPLQPGANYYPPIASSASHSSPQNEGAHHLPTLMGSGSHSRHSGSNSKRDGWGGLASGSLDSSYGRNESGSRGSDHRLISSGFDLADVYDRSNEDTSFVPHLTLMKTSQAFRRVKKKSEKRKLRILPTDFEDFVDDMALGCQRATCIELLDMAHQAADKYYACLAVSSLVESGCSSDEENEDIETAEGEQEEGESSRQDPQSPTATAGLTGVAPEVHAAHNMENYEDVNHGEATPVPLIQQQQNINLLAAAASCNGTVDVMTPLASTVQTHPLNSGKRRHQNGEFQRKEQTDNLAIDSVSPHCQHGGAPASASGTII